MSNESFFKKAKEPSKVKAQIVSKYFDAWANIISGYLQKQKLKRPSTEEVIGYIDLFAGPGRYEDNTLSTPLLIVENASKNMVHRRMLKTVFNDAVGEHIDKLKSEIEQLENYDKLLYKPVFLKENLAISTEKIIKLLSKPKLPPLILFADPWGYKGLSLELFEKVLKHFGCEIIFFFNYNRINAALTNKVLFDNMKELFGSERAFELSYKLKKKRTPAEREETIMQAVKEAMQAIGGAYTLDFKFSKGRRTSHHIIFVTKSQMGFGLMKSIMAKESDQLGIHTNNSITRFAFNGNKPQTNKKQLSLFEDHSLVADKLGRDLLKIFAGKKLTLKEIYLAHHINNHYIESDFKSAVRLLEERNLIITDPPAEKRRLYQGIRTVSDKLQITFPKN